MTPSALDSRAVMPPFEDARQQRDAVTLGMWTFLATEVMFFGVLLFGYAVARAQYPAAFAAASRQTSIVLGTFNTAVLLTSSVTMALAVRAAGLAQRRATTSLLIATAALGVTFAAVKLAEYGIDYRHHLVPALDFRFEPAHLRGAELFFWLYFVTTGLHLVHLSVGVALALVFAWRAARSNSLRVTHQVDMAGLYWHFVDLVWIFLYPCLYLVARA